VAGIDIAIGPKNGETFALGTEKASKGKVIYKKKDGKWSKFGTRGAKSISVDVDGSPWITDDDNAIWRWSGKKWSRVQGRARQIAIGADGSVFALDNIKGSDGFGVWKLD